MSGGDTLIIGNGTYSGTGNYINNPPSGSSSAYTMIQAENDGYVILSGGSSSFPLVNMEGNATIDGHAGSGSSARQYIKLQGIVAQNSSYANFYVSNARYIKLIHCGSTDAADGNNAGINIQYSEYVLVEGCYAWGAGRYKMLFYHTHYSIMRNNVIRHDYANSASMPIAGYTLYSSTNVEVQNCIDVDSDTRQWFNYDELAGSFSCPTTSGTSYSGSINFNNCIALNTKYKFGQSDKNAYAANVFWTNSVGWQTQMEDSNAFIISFGKATIDKCTFGNVSKDNYTGAYYNDYFNGWGGQSPHIVQNSILYNFNSGDPIFEYYASTYNDIYACGTLDAGSSTISNTRTNNPLTNGLLYLPRIESGSYLTTAGASGGMIGANIIYQYGKSGTLWGEPGYNLLQDGTNGQAVVKMWPFPNEDLIKTKMAAYNNHGVNGARGFAGPENDQWGQPITLTRYIWQYLGNKIPDDIYGSSGDTTPPAAPKGLKIN